MAQKHLSLTRTRLAVAAAAFVGACSLPGPYQAAPPAPQPVPRSTPVPAAAPAPPSAAAAVPAESPVLPPPPPREYRLGPAAQSLVTQARAQLARGEMPGASATLDRALRIEPSNPLLWIELARLRLAESDPHQAESCGRKALSLAGGDRRARAQAGRVLADALRAERRETEAREIEAQPWMN